MAEIVDEQQLVRAAKRNPELFMGLYDRYFAWVYRLVYARTRDQAQAEHVTAEVFLSALRHLKRYDPARQRFSTWLREITKTSLSARGLTLRSDRKLPPESGYEAAGRPAPIRPRLPTLSATAAMPLPPSEEGPGIVYALGR